jgi:hypothetical protein
MAFCYNDCIILCKKTLIFKRKQNTFAQRAHGIAVILYTDLQSPTFFPKHEVMSKCAVRCKLNCLDSQELTLDMKFTNPYRT